MNEAESTPRDVLKPVYIYHHPTDRSLFKSTSHGSWLIAPVEDFENIVITHGGINYQAKMQDILDAENDPGKVMELQRLNVQEQATGIEPMTRLNLGNDYYYALDRIQLWDDLRRYAGVRWLDDEIGLSLPIGHMLEVLPTDEFQVPEAQQALARIVTGRADAIDQARVRRIPVSANSLDLRKMSLAKRKELPNTLQRSVDRGKHGITTRDLTEAERQSVSIGQLDDLYAAVSETFARRDAMAGRLNTIVSEQKDDLKKLVDTTTGSERKLDPKKPGGLETDRDWKNRMIDEAVSWMFTRLWKMEHPGLTSSALKWFRLEMLPEIFQILQKTGSEVQEKLIQAIFKLKNLPLDDLYARLNNWWKGHEMSKGSRDLTTGIGMWVAHEEVDPYFFKDHEARGAACLILSAHQSIESTTLRSEQRISPHAVFIYRGLPIRISLPDNIDLYTIEAQVAKAIADQQQNPAFISQNLEGMSVILANLNNLLPNERKPTLLKWLSNSGINTRQAEDICERTLSFIGLLAQAEFTVSVGDDMYYPYMTGLVNAGLCKQKIQFHINELDKGYWAPKIYGCTPHWDYDVRGSTQLLRETLGKTAEMLVENQNMQVEPANHVNVVEGIGMIKGEAHIRGAYTALVRDWMDWWDKLGNTKRRNFIGRLDRYAMTHINGNELHQATVRLNERLQQTLIKDHERSHPQTVRLTDKWQAALDDFCLEFDIRDREDQQLLHQLVHEKSRLTSISTFNLLALSHMHARTKMYKWTKRENFGAIIFPVDRGIDPQTGQDLRLGAGLMSANADTIEKFNALHNLLAGLNLLNEIDKDRFLLTKERGQLEWVAKTAQRLSEITSMPLLEKPTFSDYLISQEYGPMRREISRAIKGLSAYMTIAVASGSQTARKVLKAMAELIGAGKISSLTALGQLSYVPAKYAGWGTVNIPTVDKSGEAKTEQIAKLVDFTGARSDRNQLDEVLSVVEELVWKITPMLHLSLRVPGFVAQANEKYEERFFDELTDSLVLAIATSSLTERDWGSLLIDYLEACKGELGIQISDRLTEGNIGVAVRSNLTVSSFNAFLKKHLLDYPPD